MVVSGQLIETGLWAVLWHRLVQTLRIDIMGSEPAELQDLESSMPEGALTSLSTPVRSPDWSLLSFRGLTAAVGIATAIFVKVNVV